MSSHAQWLEEPLTIEETAAKYVRPALRQVFIDLCRKPVGDYLARFEFKSDLLRAMYAVTDGFSGMRGTYNSVGTGANFLVHNMCRCGGVRVRVCVRVCPDRRRRHAVRRARSMTNSIGTWSVCQGGMGSVASLYAAAAAKHGAEIRVNAGVKSLLLDGGKLVRGVQLVDGSELRAPIVVVNADPFRMRDIVGAQNFSATYNKKLDSLKVDGSTFKLNMALKGLPKFNCLPEVSHSL